MRVRIQAVVVGILAVLLLTGCQLPGIQPATLTPVSLQLKWLHQAQFAGFYTAESEGLFRAEGLDVSIVPGGPSIDPIAQVLTGKAEFGVAPAEMILQQRSLGEPVVALATTYRLNPRVLVSLAESDITAPEHLLGKRVAIGGNPGELQLRAMMNFLKLDYSRMHIVPYDLDLTAFYAGEVDVVPAFIAGSLVPMLATGREFNLISSDDYGIHFYSDTIFTTEEMIASRPEVVTGFLRAALGGHQLAVQEPGKATEYSLAYLDGADPEVQSQMILSSIPLINTGDDSIGWMRSEVWHGMYDTLLEQGFIQTQIDVEQVYTMEFLEAVYNSDP